jgi:hypothetical protein
MKVFFYLAFFLAFPGCKISNKRHFGSADSRDNNAAVDSKDAVILGKDVPGEVLDGMGKGPGTGGNVPGLSTEIKAKLSKCYPQWEKAFANKDGMFDIRQVSLDVEKLKRSNLELAGTNPEVVFIDITASSKISQLNITMGNPKALYCLDISANKSVNRLDIRYICGAKLGIIEIEGAKVKRINSVEYCDAGK